MNKKIIFILLALVVAISAKGKTKKGHKYDKEYEDYVGEIDEIDQENLDDDEIDKREKTFKKHKKNIDEFNKKNELFKLGYTVLTDREPEEAIQERCKLKRPPTPRALPYTFLPPSISYSSVPDSLDYRPLAPPALDQGKCGSCYAFATLDMLNMWNKKRTNGTQSIVFAPQAIVDCDTVDSGCNGGWPKDTLNWITSSGQSNLPQNPNYPYTSGTTAVKGTCKIGSVARTPVGYQYSHEVDVNGNEAYTKFLLSIYGPMVAAMYAPSCYAFTNYKGGIFTGAGCTCPTGSTCTSLNHAMLLVGYGLDTASNTPFWIVRNSWGPTWGENGYIRILRGATNLCNIICTIFAVE